MELMVFLQDLHKEFDKWSEADIEMLISEAYVYRTHYDSSI